MLIRLHTTTNRVVQETWLLEVPDALAEDVLRDPQNVMRYVAVDADIVVHRGVEVVETSSRTFDSTEPVEPEYVGQHRAEG